MNAGTKMVDGLTTSLHFMLNVGGCRGGVVNSSLDWSISWRMPPSESPTAHSQQVKMVGNKEVADFTKYHHALKLSLDHPEWILPSKWHVQKWSAQMCGRTTEPPNDLSRCIKQRARTTNQNTWFIGMAIIWDGEPLKKLLDTTFIQKRWPLVRRTHLLPEVAMSGHVGHISCPS